MVRVHSRVPRDSPDYHGPILVNPGGPGGSGVDLVLKAGPLLSTILGPGFDIIGFDPRGMLEIYMYANGLDLLERRRHCPIHTSSLVLRKPRGARPVA
jgi:hypothetical protein